MSILSRTASIARGLLVVALFGVLAVFAGAWVVTRYLLTAEHINTYLAPPLERTLGRDLDAKSFRLTPRGLEFTGVTLSEDPRFTTDEASHFITAERLRFGLDLLALLDRKVVIQDATLTAPVIHVRRSADKHWNFASIAESTRKRGPQEAEEAARGGFYVELDTIEFTNATVTLTDESLRSGTLRIEMKKGSGRAARAPRDQIDLRASGSVHSKYTGTTIFDLHGAIDLARGTIGGTLSGDRAVIGDIEFDHVELDIDHAHPVLTFNTLHADVVGGELNAQGTVDFEKTGAVYEGRAELDGLDLGQLARHFATSAARHISGRADVLLDFDVAGRDWPEILASLALGTESVSYSGTADAKVDVRIQALDLDALLLTWRGSGDASADEPPSPGLGPYDTGHLRTAAALSVGTLRYKGESITDVVGEIDIEDGEVRMRDLSASAAGGSLHVDGTIDLREPGLAYHGNISLKDGDFAVLGSPLPRAYFGEYSGTAGFALQVDGRGTTLASSLESLNASGTVSIANARIRDSKLFRSIGKATGIENMKDFRIIDGGGRIDIRDQWVTTERLVFGDGDARLILIGGIGFDAKIDLEVWIGLGPDRRRKLFSRGLLLPYVVDSDKWTNIPVLVKGTLDKIETTIPYDAYANTAVHAVPDTAGRVIHEGASATKKVVKGSVDSIKTILGGLGKMVLPGGRVAKSSNTRSPAKAIRSKRKDGAKNTDGVPADSD